MYYARVIPMWGAGPDRRTPTYKTERGMLQGIRRELRRLRNPGPFMVEQYVEGKRVSCTQEG